MSDGEGPDVADLNEDELGVAPDAEAIPDQPDHF